MWLLPGFLSRLCPVSAWKSFIIPASAFAALSAARPVLHKWRKKKKKKTWCAVLIEAVDRTSDYQRTVTVVRETARLPQRLRGNKRCQAPALLFQQLSHTAHFLRFTLKLHRMLSYAEPHRVLRPVTEPHYWCLVSQHWECLWEEESIVACWK